MPCHCERSTRIRHEPRSSGLKESNNRTHRKPRCLPAKAMEMKRAMIEKKMEVVLHGPREASVHEEMRAASSTIYTK